MSQPPAWAAGRRADGAEVPIPDEANLRQLRAALAEIRPPPTLVFRLLHELSNPNADARTVAQIVASDASLSTSILQAINSAYHGLSRRVVDVKQAVTLLGFNTVRALVMQLGLKDLLEQPAIATGYQAADLWAHSLCVSFLADRVARRAIGVDPGLASTLGLLHDLGKLAINSRFPERLSRMFERPAGGKTFLKREVEVFGTTHAFIGGELAGTWKLPAELAQGIYFHHSFRRLPDNMSPSLRRTILAVLVANQLAKYHHVYCADMEIDLLPDDILEEIGLDPPLEALVDDDSRRAVTRAILFIEAIVPRRLSAAQPLVDPKTWNRLARTGVERLPVPESLSSVLLGPTELLGAMSTGSPPTIAVGPGAAVAIDGVDAPDLVLVAAPEDASLRALLEGLHHALARFRVDPAIERPLRALARRVAGNVLQGSGAGKGEVRLRIWSLGEVIALCFEAAALRFEHRAPVAALRRAAGPEGARRFLAHVVARSLGPPLGLGWIDRIDVDDDGGRWALVKTVPRELR